MSLIYIDFLLFSLSLYLFNAFCCFSDLASLFLASFPTSPPLQLNDEVFEDPGNAYDPCLQCVHQNKALPITDTDPNGSKICTNVNDDRNVLLELTPTPNISKRFQHFLCTEDKNRATLHCTFRIVLLKNKKELIIYSISCEKKKLYRFGTS